ncbi:holliday junction DNA helicase RuvA [Candidatus Kinetoplastibacterium desouzaii TCC079E]|uniref:Holliday junction branch migration complex subunit RuvA n=1 Tax=Candidatus Kinetoplastidibacterium desouzai TCC079E TaxID=1208919 RepID=M1LSI7_9PROT|nr:Holliday junction branch migration protein RuvA [Candidatus Kinetoplastibacterium desouzaii]AGF47091.1 holliday junction DNA helicase RuvA [Candidatus Kinetoplastibacterium desouzaii TCC079E]
MIERLSGIILDKWTNSICLDVNGLGYEVEVPTNIIQDLPEIGEKIVLYTHLLIREDAHILFGFNNTKERTFFRLLMKINGVGARTSLSILSNMTIDELISVITNQNSSALTKIPGIGQKTAERLILEMKDKIKSTCTDNISVYGKKSDIIEALVSLGYSSREVLPIMNLISNNLNIQDAIKQALKLLNARK